MNRAQRRLQQKQWRKMGLTKEQAKQAVADTINPELKEGQKVKLNYELMIRSKDWKNQDEDFKQWVTEHKNEIFTVEYNKTKQENKEIDFKFNVNLVEDTTDPKWLFFSQTLIELPTAKIKLDDGTTQEIVLESYDKKQILREVGETVNDL